MQYRFCIVVTTYEKKVESCDDPMRRAALAAQLGAMERSLGEDAAYNAPKGGKGGGDPCLP